MAEVTLNFKGVDDVTGVVSNVAGSLNGLSNLVTGTLSVAFGNVLSGAIDSALGAIQAATGAVADFFKQGFADALEAEQTMTRISGLLENQADAATETAAAWADAQGKFVTSTVASQDQLSEWGEDLETAQAKLFDLQVRLQDKEPTETQKLQLERLGETVTDLQGKIQAGSQTITTDLAGALGLVQPQVGLTMEAVNKLGAQFQDLAGGSDDVVFAIIEMGLRMGNIAAHQMPDFIQTTLDLAAATGQDAVAAARLLAQAQEDPISALTRFRRMGIQFSEDLEAQIKKMVEAGDTAGAFALVMERLGIATGGQAAAQAETLAGKWEILKNRLSEAGETIGASVLPLATRLFDEVIKPAIPVVEGLAATFAAFVQAIAGGGDLNKAIDALAGGIYRAFGPEAGLAVMQFRDFLVGLMGRLPEVASFFKPVIDAAHNLVQAFVESMPMIQAKVAEMVTFVQAKIAEFGPVIIANVAEILEQLTTFWKNHGDEIMEIVKVAWEIIVVTVGGALTLLSGIVAAGLALLNGDTTTALETTKTTWKTFTDAVLSIVGQTTDEFLANWEGTFELAGIITTTLWNQMLDTIAIALNKMVLDISLGILGFLGTWEANWQQAKLIVSTIWDQIVAATSALVARFTEIGGNIIAGMISGIRGAVSGLVSAAVGAALDAFNAAKAALGISSPSKLFAGIGANMMDGMALGISANAGKPAGAMNAAIGNATNNYTGGNTFNFYGVQADMEYAYLQASAGAM